MMRQARRRRRQRLLTTAIVAIVVIAASVAGYIEYQRYTADRAAAQLASANATATRVARIQATATAEQLAACLAGLKSTPTPSAGPAKPPTETGTPVTLSDGLQYIDLQVGCGPAAKSGSTVSVQYTGWLEKTGKKFDSSYDRHAQPISVALGQGQVIKGWDEGVVGMKRGGSRRLIIPAALAYGAAGQPPTIPPNSTLIFDVTVVSISG
jgi:FKBP-type peptidyl-prolyl cis-trans isomerase